MSTTPRGLDALIPTTETCSGCAGRAGLGAVERAILLAAEREARPAQYWTGAKNDGLSDVEVVALATLEALLRRSSELGR